MIKHIAVVVLTVVFIGMLFTATFSEEGLETLVGKTFKLDKKATQAYLKENKVVPDEVIPRLDRFMDRLVVKWKEGVLEVEAWSGTATVEYRLIKKTENGIVLEVEDELGKWSKVKISLTPNGYWQEMDAFPGYMEKFVVYTEEE